MYRVTCTVKGKTQSFLLEDNYADFSDAVMDFVEFVETSGFDGDKVESNNVSEVAFFRSVEGDAEIHMKREHA